MNREVEERIVRMYFDNQDFEKNAKTTIDTLDQLKNGLNLEDSTKGMEVFDKVSKKLDFTKANQSLAKMKTGLKSMNGALGKIFKIGENPIKEAEGVINSIRSMFTKVIGVDIASTVINGFKNAFRSLTIAPVKAGWSQYEQKMDSVKTIMSSTGESIDVVEQHLQGLTEYANKTIYSLTDMTSNLGKFTNNGMKLEDSVKAMEGIANAAADAGQGAQQASMAMYNFSQAMGVGKMTTIDWKSIENANMATRRLKNTFIEMAAANGKLQKEFDKTDQKYHYYITTNSKGQVEKDKKKWTEVTASNFRETLSKDWLDAQSMMHALMIYSGDRIDPDTLKSWGITDPDEIKALEKIGADALEAATQVRTFTKMMDALKESVQSGWATTFELIFGNMNQGTNFWTQLNNTLDDVLSKSAEIRNNILKIWSGEYADTSKQEEEVADKNELLASAEARLKSLLDSEDIDQNLAKIKELQGYIEKYNEEIDKLKQDNRGGKNNKKIKTRQEKVKEYKQKIKELEAANREADKKQQKRLKRQSEMDELQAQIDSYQEQIRTARNTLSYTNDEDEYAKRLADITANERKMEELKKKLKKLQDEDDKDELVKTQKEVEKLQEEIEKLNAEIDEEQGKAKSEFVDDQGRTGREIAIDSLMELIELAKELGSAVSEAFHNVFGQMDGEKLFNLTQRIAEAVHRIRDWFYEADENGVNRIEKIKKVLEGFFSLLKIGLKIIRTILDLVKRVAQPIINFLVDKLAKVGEFFSGLADLNFDQILEKIKEGFTKVWEKIKNLFTPKKLGDGTEEMPIATYLKNGWQKLKTTVRQWAEDNGLMSVYNKITEFKDKIVNWEGWTKISEFFTEGKKKLTEIWNNVKKWPIWTTLGKFFSDFWGWVAGLFGSKQDNLKILDEDGNPIVRCKKELDDIQKERTDDPKEFPLIKYLQGIWDEVINVWEAIKGWEGWTSIGEFFTNAWNWVTGLFKKPVDRSANIEKILDEDGNPVLRSKKELEEILNQNEENDPKNFSFLTYLNNVWEEIKKAWNKIKEWEGWTSIGEFFANAWNWVSGLFRTPQISKNLEGVLDDDGNPIIRSKKELEELQKESVSGEPKSPILEFLTTVWEGIKNVWAKITDKDFWAPIGQFFSDFWGWLSDTFGIVVGFFTEPEENGATGFANFLQKIWDFLKEIWEGKDGNGGIAHWTGWEKIGNFFADIWAWVLEKANATGSFFTVKQDNGLTKFEEFLNEFWTTITGLWEQISGWSGWTSIGGFFSNIWGWISNKLGIGRTNNNEISGAVSGVADMVSDSISGVSKATEQVNGGDVDDTKKSIGFLKRIMGAFTGLFDSIKEIASNVTSLPHLTKFIDSMGTFLNGFLNLISNILSALGRVMAGEATAEDWQGIVAGGIVVLVTKIFELVNNKNLAKITSTGTKFAEIAGGILMISMAVAILTALDPDKMAGAVVAVIAIGAVVSTIMGILAKIESSKTEQAKLTGSQQVLNNLISTLGKVGMVAAAMALLPEIIKTIGDVKKETGGMDIGADALNIMLGLAGLISGVSVSLAIAQKIAPQGLDPIATLKTVLAVIGAIALVLAAAAGIVALTNTLVGDDVDGTVKDINNAGEILSALGGAIGLFFASLFSGGTKEQNVTEAERAAKKLDEMAQVFDEEKVTGINRMIRLMQSVSEAAQGVDTKYLGDFGEMMGQFGTGIYNLAVKLNEIDGPLAEISDTSSDIYNRLVNFMTITRMITEAAGQFGSSEFSFKSFIENIKALSKTQETYYDERLGYEVPLASSVSNLDTWVDSLSKIMKRLGEEDWVKDSGIQFDGLNIASKLVQSIQDGLLDPKLPKFDATPIVASILDALKLQDTAIAEVVHNMVQNGMILSSSKDGEGGYEVSENGLEFLNKWLDSGSNMDNLIDMSSFKEQVLGKDGQGGIVGELNSLSESIPSITSIFDGKGWLDFKDENGEPIDILGEMTSQITELGTTLSEMEPIKVSITPVFNMNEMTRNNLQKALDERIGLMPLTARTMFENATISIDFEKAGEELGINAINSKLDLILTAIGTSDTNNTTAIGGLGGHMDGIANEVGNLKLVLDTGVLVGEMTPLIDLNLGVRSNIYSKTGVVFRGRP